MFLQGTAKWNFWSKEVKWIAIIFSYGAIFLNESLFKYKLFNLYFKSFNSFLNCINSFNSIILFLSWDNEFSSNSVLFDNFVIFIFALFNSSVNWLIVLINVLLLFFSSSNSLFNFS